MTTPMPPKDQRKLLRSLEKQGCTIIPTTSGWRVLYPDGKSSSSIHRSHGDYRSRKNLRAEVLRAGLIWPL